MTPNCHDPPPHRPPPGLGPGPIWLRMRGGGSEALAYGNPLLWTNSGHKTKMDRTFSGARQFALGPWARCKWCKVRVGKALFRKTPHVVQMPPPNDTLVTHMLAQLISAYFSPPKLWTHPCKWHLQGGGVCHGGVIWTGVLPNWQTIPFPIPFHEISFLKFQTGLGFWNFNNPGGNFIGGGSRYFEPTTFCIAWVPRLASVVGLRTVIINFNKRSVCGFFRM